MQRVLLLWIWVLPAAPCGARVITVDDDGPADFNNIQAAIDDSNNGDTIIVRPGLYKERMNFRGKNIRLRSTNPNNPKVVAATIIEYHGGDGPAVVFQGTEDANCTFAGFNVRGGIIGFDWTIDPSGERHTHATIGSCLLQGGLCSPAICACDGIISNCVVADNNNPCCVYIYDSPAIDMCHGLIRNCTIVNSRWEGVRVRSDGGQTTMQNCIIYYNGQEEDLPQIVVESGATLNISYCCLQGGLGGVVSGGTVNWGPGNTDADPCFVRLGYWGYEEPNCILFEGDYRLKSEGWRWDKNFDPPRWTYDYVTSRCIDAGNPGSPLRGELLTIPGDPNHIWGRNLRINMGAYGGTPQASMPPYDWALLGDITNDGIVNGRDFAHQASDWLSSGDEQPGDLNKSGIVNVRDVGLFVDDWLKTTSWYE